ncbi:MAG: transglutaminase domain-containing protein [Candidatus Omnitrophica bacterium]|nr:transglutaminase domain-containing protein [Candidatus Omnitrophota bacterium]
MLRPAITLFLLIILSGCAWTSPGVFGQRPAQVEAIKSVVDTLPEEYQLGVKFALYRAGRNSGELVKALRSLSGEELTGMAFLITHMPRRDLRSLKADFLIENVALAYRARRELPWGANVPQDIFLNYVLPYVNINETREPWRRYFFEKYAGLARDQDSMGAAASFLNLRIFTDHGITYNLKTRPKPDQSPRETMAAGVASCTGQSIMIADALRAVGIPARVVGTPLWSDRSGNHTWFEVWEDGAWHFQDANREGRLDEAWFAKPAADPQMAGPLHRIYAASYRRTDILFPTIWAPLADDVYATDVTMDYRTEAE